MTILIILFLGFLIRLVSLNQSLWLDEGTTALISRMDLRTIFVSFLPGDFHPPLYYMFIKIWTGIFGISEISLRIPSVVFGVLTIYTTYLIAKHFYNAKAGIYAAALLASSGLSVYYSQEARMYSMTAFLVSFTVYSFLKRKWILFSISLALTGLADYVALFMLPVLVVFGYRDKKFFYSLIPLLAVFLAWQPVFLKQITVGLFIKSAQPGWWNILGTLSVKNLALFPVKFILGRISIENDFLYLLTVLAVCGFYAVLFVKSFRSGKFLIWWLFVPIAVAVLASFKVPTLNYFRFLFCLPAMYVLAGGAVIAYKKPVSTVMVAILFGINIFSTMTYLIKPEFHREDWRSLVNFVENNKTPNSITIFVAKSNMEAYKYYAPTAQIAGPEAVKKGYDNVWLMTYLGDIFDPGGTVKTNLGILGYEYKKEYNFNGVGVIHYAGK